MKFTLLFLALTVSLIPSLGFSQGCEENDFESLPSLRCSNAVESLSYQVNLDGSISVTYQSKNSNNFSGTASRLLNVEFTDLMKGQLVVNIPAESAKRCLKSVSQNNIALLSCSLGTKSASVEIVDGDSRHAWTKGPAVALDVKTSREESARGPHNQVKYTFSFYKYGTFETAFDMSECR